MAVKVSVMLNPHDAGVYKSIHSCPYRSLQHSSAPTTVSVLITTTRNANSNSITSIAAVHFSVLSRVGNCESVTVRRC